MSNHLISADALGTTTAPGRFKTYGEPEKRYEYGRKGRPPFVLVDVFSNGVTVVESVQTGNIFIADPEGREEAFALAKRISENNKAKDYQAGW